MTKKIIGLVLILLLIGIFLINIFNKSEKNKANEEQSNGGVIMSEEAEGISVGQTPPDFELTTLDGQKIKRSDLEGKKVILNFWASWCPPCKKEMPEMQKFYEQYHDEIEIIAINTFEKNPENVKPFIEENGITFPILLDNDSEVGNQYKAIALPTTYFIGTDGTVQNPRKIGPMTFEFMEEMMNTLE